MHKSGCYKSLDSSFKVSNCSPLRKFRYSELALQQSISCEPNIPQVGDWDIRAQERRFHSRICEDYALIIQHTFPMSNPMVKKMRGNWFTTIRYKTCSSFISSVFLTSALSNSISQITRPDTNFLDNCVIEFSNAGIQFVVWNGYI